MKSGIAIFVLIFMNAVLLFAEDAVTIKDGSGKSLELKGKIFDYSSREGLVFQRIGRTDKEIFPYDQVISISPELTDTLKSAETKFKAKEYANALELYGKAREEDSRTWAQLYWTGQRVKCLKALSRDPEAIEEFFLVLRYEPFPWFFDTVPLSWDARALRGSEPKLERLALLWINPMDNPSGKYNPGGSLLAASILFSGTQNDLREQALRMFELLAMANRGSIEGVDQPLSADMRTISKIIAQGAIAQQWRQKVFSLKSERELVQWETMSEQMPEPLRPGPLMLIGDGYSKFRKNEQAITFWMRVPILHEQERFLSAKALWESGKALESLDRKDQAEKIFHELSEDFKDIPVFYDAAARKLEKTH